MIRVQVHLYSQSQPVEMENVRNTYTKGGLYCVMIDPTTVFKFPMEHIFRVKEIG